MFLRFPLRWNWSLLIITILIGWLSVSPFFWTKANTCMHLLVLIKQLKKHLIERWRAKSLTSWRTLVSRFKIVDFLCVVRRYLPNGYFSEIREKWDHVRERSCIVQYFPTVIVRFFEIILVTRRNYCYHRKPHYDDFFVAIYRCIIWDGFVFYI